MTTGCASYAMATRAKGADLLVDTSVAISLVVEDHTHHRATMDAIGARRLGLAGHAAFETFSVLSRLPGPGPAYAGSHRAGGAIPTSPPPGISALPRPRLYSGASANSRSPAARSTTPWWLRRRPSTVSRSSRAIGGRFPPTAHSRSISNC